MPTYEYVCTKCSARHEVVRSFSDPPLTRCPTCRGKLRKVFGSVGVVLKGSGFYRNDSRSGSSSARPAAREPAAAGTSGASSSSAESSSGSGANAGSGGDAKPTTTAPAGAANP